MQVMRGGEAALQSLREYGSPIADLSEATPYLEVQRFFDADYPAHEMRYYWKSRYLNELSAEAIDALIGLNEASPSHHFTLDVWQLGGAFGRIPPHNTAFGDRSAPYLIGIEANWESPEDDAVCIEWGREVFRALEPFSSDREYFNFPRPARRGGPVCQGYVWCKPRTPAVGEAEVRPGQHLPAQSQHSALTVPAEPSEFVNHL